jgi:hypothetical protein
MPLLILQHVEGLVEDEVTHGVKAKPEEEIAHVGDPVRCYILFDAYVELVDVLEDLLLILGNC